jgi:VanZ family protein
MIKFLFSLPQWLRILLSLLYLGIVAMLSLIASDEVPKIEVFKGFDKLVHFCLYFGLTMLASWTFNAELKRSRIIYIILLSATFGMLMEVVQLEMQLGRSFEWTDELSNIFGSLLGAFVYKLIADFHRKEEGKKASA